MTVQQLKNFLATAEVLNFHKASDKMHIAQPALSRQIQNLETEIGAELFDRTKKQIKLTAAGLFFKQEATALLVQLEQAKKKAAQIHKGEAGQISIGHVSSAIQYIIPPFLNKIKAAYPDLRISLSEAACPVIFDKIINKELDFGILPNAVAPDTIEEVTLYQENFVVVVPQSMNVNVKPSKVLKSLSKADWILSSKDDGYSFNEILYNLFQENGFTPKVAFESPSAFTNLQLVSEGLGVTVVAKSALNNLNLAIKYYELKNISSQLEMRFVWLKERNEELKEYIQLFLKIFSEITSKKTS